MPDPESPWEQSWETFSKGVFNAAVEALGYTRKSNADWLNKNDPKIRQALEERNQVLRTKFSNPTEVNLQRLKTAKGNLQRKFKTMENDWWFQKAEEMQQMADENYSSGFFKFLKEVYGPSAQMSKVLLTRDENEVLAEPNQLTRRWK